MTRLTELEPEWLTVGEAGIGHVRAAATDLASADGILFQCPLCWAKNKGAAGTHSVICWFHGRNVPSDLEPGPGRWYVHGTGFDDLTLSPSVHLSNPAGCGWHGWVASGKVS